MPDSYERYQEAELHLNNLDTEQKALHWLTTNPIYFSGGKNNPFQLIRADFPKLNFLNLIIYF